MINIEKGKNVLEEYIKAYDKTNPRIALKAGHIFRVANASKRIAEELNLSEEQIKLAELIGLLHDIGRFEQLRIYDTFSDRDSVDHAELGVKILNENKLLYKFCEDEKYYSIILTAISNHNKFKIANGLDEETLIQSKIIRDADKIDILNLLQFEKFDTLFKKDNIIDEPVTEGVLQAFMENKQLDRANLKTSMDFWINNISYIFDINFKPSFKIIKENDYINKLIDRTKTEDMEKIRIVANKYIDKQCA